MDDVQYSKRIQRINDELRERQLNKRQLSDILGESYPWVRAVLSEQPGKKSAPLVSRCENELGL